MQSSDLKNKMLSGAIWQSMDRLGLQGFNFILQIILARLLLPADFGIVVLLDVFIQIAWCFIDSGLGASMVQCREAEEKDFSGIYWLSQGIAVVCYMLLFFAAPWIAEFYRRPPLSTMLRVTALSLFLSRTLPFVLPSFRESCNSRNFSLSVFLQPWQVECLAEPWLGWD